jgi:pyruvate,water dikinase
VPRERRFPYPDEVKLPSDVDSEAYRRMYAYYQLPVSILFEGDPPRELVDWERRMFWYHDAIHHADVMYPMDHIHNVHWQIALSSYNSRIFIVPPAQGIPHRLVNGYLFLSFVPVVDPKEVERRLQLFQRRAGYYYQNWNRIYKEWGPEAEKIIKEMESLEFKDLPEFEPEDVVLKHMAIAPSAYSLIDNWLRLVTLHLRLWWKHFEMLNLGYAAYLLFYQFMKQKFPDIPDQHVALMVAGIYVLLFEPDMRLRKLARLAVELGVADRLLSFEDAYRMEEELGRDRDPRVQQWLKEWNNTKYPWFYYTSGQGFYHHEPRWIDDLNVPFSFLKDYITRVKRGEALETATERLRRQGDEIARKYRELLGEGDRKTFDEYLGLAKTVYPYVEEHNFYIEHWGHTVWYRKVRDVAKILHKHGFLEDPEDIWYMNWVDVYWALMDLVASWAVDMPAVGRYYWPREIRKRKEILRKLKEEMQSGKTPPALGVPPEVVTEPFTVMLWGITGEKIKDWLDAYYGQAVGGEVKVIRGYAASPGVAEGEAVVIRGPEEFHKVKEGQILVASTTTPTWTSLFTRVKAVVTDVGGMMSHGAIVAREYGIPAVTGTGSATRIIRDGMKIRVDGYRGVVEIIG